MICPRFQVSYAPVQQSDLLQDSVWISCRIRLIRSRGSSWRDSGNCSRNGDESVFTCSTRAHATASRQS